MAPLNPDQSWLGYVHGWWRDDEGVLRPPGEHPREDYRSLYGNRREAVWTFTTVVLAPDVTANASMIGSASVV